MIVVLFQLVHALILWTLEFFPYPELFVYPYLTSVGFLPYREILDQHFPGLMFLPLNFYTLGFRTPSSFKVLLIIITLIQSSLIFKFTRSRLAVFLYSLWQPFFEGNYLWLDNFLPLFSLPALIFFTSQNWVLSGLFLGLGVTFKQSLLPLLSFVIAVLLFRRQYQAAFQFTLAALLPISAMLVYLLRVGVLSDFFFWTIQFNLTTFAAQAKLAPTLGELAKLILPMFIVVSAIVWDRNSRLYAGWGFFSIFEVFSRFGLNHLQTALPFLIIIQARQKSRLLPFLISSVILVFIFYSRQRNFFSIRYFDSQTLTLISLIQSHTHPGDKIFLLGVQPHVYSLTQTLPAGQIFVFQFPWFLDLAGKRILTGLESDPPKLVVYNSHSTVNKRYLKDYAGYLVNYLQDYQPIDQIGPTTIYARSH